jgi:oligopeptide transport system permease protein
MISGYYGKKVELVMSGLIDVIESIPQVLYAIILMTIFSRITSYTKVFRNFDGSLMGVFVTLSLTFWIPISRIIKSETKKIKNKEYVIYAKNKGANFTHIMFKHVFPNCLQTIVIIVIQNIPNSIFIETFLSFIGIGIQPPKPSIGKLINYGVSGMRTYPYALFIPAMALIIIIYLFNLLGREYIKTVENEWINIG